MNATVSVDDPANTLKGEMTWKIIENASKDYNYEIVVLNTGLIKKNTDKIKYYTIKEVQIII